jgi:hypothetical protein
MMSIRQTTEDVENKMMIMLRKDKTTEDDEKKMMIMLIKTAILYFIYTF